MLMLLIRWMCSLQKYSVCLFVLLPVLGMAGEEPKPKPLKKPTRNVRPRSGLEPQFMEIKSLQL